jgi:hypothetical protein
MAHTEPFQIRIGDLRERFRPQREWAEGRGLLLIVAHFLTGSGAGAWLVAVLLGLTTGLMMGFALVAVGAFFHLLFLGRPERFWRMMKGFATSWISRGIIGVTLFLASAAFYLSPALGLGETLGDSLSFFRLERFGSWSTKALSGPPARAFRFGILRWSRFSTSPMRCAAALRC